MAKSAEAFRTISEVAEILDTPAHVLRFWESQFPQIRPMKRAGGRRYYRPQDVALIAGIRKLLHEDGITIRGVRKILREQGVRHVSDLAAELPAETTAEARTDAATQETLARTPEADAPAEDIAAAAHAMAEPEPEAPAPVTAPSGAAPMSAPSGAAPISAPSGAEREPRLPFGARPSEPPVEEAPMQVDVPTEPRTATARVHAFPAPSGPEATPPALSALIRAADPVAASHNREALAALYRRLAALRDRRRAAGQPPQG